MDGASAHPSLYKLSLYSPPLAKSSSSKTLAFLVISLSQTYDLLNSLFKSFLFPRRLCSFPNPKNLEPIFFFGGYFKSELLLPVQISSFLLSFFLSSSFSSTLSRESPAFFCPFFGLQNFGCLKQNLSTKRLSSTNPNLLLLLRPLLPALPPPFLNSLQLPYSVFHAPPLCCHT